MSAESNEDLVDNDESGITSREGQAVTATAAQAAVSRGGGTGGGASRGRTLTFKYVGYSCIVVR